MARRRQSPDWTKQEQIELMWREHEAGRDLLDEYLRKLYRGKSAEQVYQILLHDKNGVRADIWRFHRNDPVADYYEVVNDLGVLALID